jgi:glyoxalase family protein
MVHRILWRVASTAALDFWAARLGDEGVETARVGEGAAGDRSSSDGRLRFADPEGLEHELLVADVPDPPLVADHPEVPAEMALQGFHGARAYAPDPDASRPLLEQGLAFEPLGERGWEARGEERGGLYFHDEPPGEPGRSGAGTVHHVAWSAALGEEEDWRRRALEQGARATPVIDRFYFRSVYFREPSGVLFEIATRGPGFTIDEPLESLGEKVSIPPFLEDRRAEIEPNLKPLPNPRGAAAK